MTHGFGGGKLRIVVLSRGWVQVGICRQRGRFVTITDCWTIQRAGTTGGLGQLAREGPNANTVLERDNPTTVHELTIVKVQDCDTEAWEGHGHRRDERGEGG